MKRSDTIEEIQSPVCVTEPTSFEIFVDIRVEKRGGVARTRGSCPPRSQGVSLRKRRRTDGGQLHRKAEDIDLRLPFSQSAVPTASREAAVLVNAAQFVRATPLMDWRNHPNLGCSSSFLVNTVPCFRLFYPVCSRPNFCIHFTTLSLPVSFLPLFSFSSLPHSPFPLPPVSDL